MRVLLLLVLALGCATTTPASPTPTHPEPTPMTEASTLDRIAAAAASRPFTADGVHDALGALLSVDNSTSNKFFTVYRGTASVDGVTSVEVREPMDPTKGGMLLLQLDGCLTRADVGERFGPTKPGPPAAPSPRAPADHPHYDIHPADWGEVRLGYRPSDGCLVTVVLDAQ